MRSLGRLLVAYSGGVDSAFLAWAAHQELGSNMLAVLADSPSLARSQMQDAVAFAEEHGIPLQVVETDEMERDDYRRNDGARCFHCKDELLPGWKSFGGSADSMPSRTASTSTTREIIVPGRRPRVSTALLRPCWTRG